MKRGEYIITIIILLIGILSYFLWILSSVQEVPTPPLQ